MSHTLGFIGLGVMGGSMCANLTRKSSKPVHVFDMSADAVAKAVEAGAIAEASIDALAQRADIVFLSLPSIVQVEAVCASLRDARGKVRTIVDMSTSDVARTRALAASLAADGIDYVDAPVARTAEAAIKGTLLIMTGASAQAYASLEPLLACMGSDLLHCGGVGAGQTVKILNNMMVFMTVNALAEILTIGRRAGLDGKTLFDMLSKGSADSFALRNHGMKSLVPDTYPEKIFPMAYAIKDAALALTLAKEAGFEPHIAQHTYDIMCEARDAGFAQNYHPAMVRVVDGRIAADKQADKQADKHVDTRASHPHA
ncbi:NAD(P)-dependent oxidoreductase [Pararobbsia silviterrae]|uniref:NAD(P)-dependent oxidoreductase n=1 Tax=Pararobbsia silviterrae TaxID=1792498 RepID=A0A494Y5T5_9BURK|nr:NAD(P)-dependent oxidoreductase [Pararobbsia silviterrae]RKP57643.1 NAD(P)-dependent oxidoreductase [Pararobbsia silviterrae]